MTRTTEPTCDLCCRNPRFINGFCLSCQFGLPYQVGMIIGRLLRSLAHEPDPIERQECYEEAVETARKFQDKSDWN